MVVSNSICCPDDYYFEDRICVRDDCNKRTLDATNFRKSETEISRLRHIAFEKALGLDKIST